MNRMSAPLGLTVVALLLAFHVGQWVLVSDFTHRLAEETLAQEQATADLSRLQAEYESLKTSLAGAPAHVPLRWLGMGEEPSLLRGLCEAASASRVILREFEFLPIFHLKGPEDRGIMPTTQAFPEQLPQFDEQTGQAIGLGSDEGEFEWPGVEVLPVRIEVQGTGTQAYAGIVGFFLKARRTLPQFQVHSMELGIEPSGDIKGKAILVFPVFAKSLPFAREPRTPAPIGSPSPSTTGD